MRISDFAMFIPNAFFTMMKFVRGNIDIIGKEEILKNGLYHITPNEETAKKIVESEHLKPAKGLLKNVVSYGTSCVCLFNGTPDIDNYLKNLADFNSITNPYLNPTMAVNAVKIMPTEMSELSNYHVRSFSDNVIIYEGYCILPKNKITTVYLVPDLVRDKNGIPLVNPKTKRYEIRFREALENELSENKKSYKAKEDYIQFVNEERERNNYSEGNNIFHRLYNKFNTIVHISNIEGRMARKSIAYTIVNNIKSKIASINTPKLDMGTDEKITTNLEQFSNKRKNPYRDKKYGEQVAQTQAQGLVQLDLKQQLEKITTSEIGEYLRKKYTQIDKNLLNDRGIHNINHNNRMAILSLIIAQNEGVLTDNRIMDILLSASYYHNISRKNSRIIDNLRPHSKKSAKMLGKIDLEYTDGTKYSEDDKRTLQAIVEALEYSDKSINKVCKKYKIKQENITETIKLMEVLKDADDLDRVRLDFNTPFVMKTNLKPKNLRLDTAKQLLDASYELEYIVDKVPFDRIIAYKTNKQTAVEQSKTEARKEQFRSYLREGVNKSSKMLQHLKRKLTLKKTKFYEKLHGKNIMNKIKQLLLRQNKEERDER